MKKHLIIYLATLLVSFCLMSCHSFDRQVKSFQKTLNKQESRAEKTTMEMARALQGNSADSICFVANKTPDILYFVFNSSELVYWSNNWLSDKNVLMWMNGYDKWYFRRFDNAITICRWTQAGSYNILTVIPIKYNYSFENSKLKNTYIAPFEMDDDVEIRQTKVDGGYRIFDNEGNYVFSLREKPDDEPIGDEGFDPLDNTALSESFSYPGVMAKGTNVYHVMQRDETLAGIAKKHNISERSLRKKNNIAKGVEPAVGTKLIIPNPHHVVYVSIAITAIFGIFLLLMAAYGLVRSRGLRNMKMSVKFQYLIVIMLLISFVYVFVVSILYVHNRYEDRQVEELKEKTRYIQSQLKDYYSLDYGLSPYNSEGLNVDLRYLRYIYGTDIHVYGLDGKLLGSSIPQLFDSGVMSNRMASDPFFTREINSRDSICILRESIGGMQYLSSYVEFFNGSDVTMGYIEVPYYISSKERHLAIDAFLSRLLPPFLVVMIIAVILGLLLSRNLTRPLKTLAEGMKGFKVGGYNAHLEYSHNDEIGQLVTLYNQMVDELDESTSKLARSERETAWRTMARQIAHEINNPLTPMKLNLQQLQRLKTNDDPRFDEYFERSTQTLIEQIDNLSRIASSFSTFAKMPAVVTSKVDIAEKLSSVITLFRTNQNNIPVRYVGADKGIFVKADTEQITLVFNNLIKNALQAIGDRPDGDIIVVLRDEARSVEISISDNGGGIPEDIREKVFIPNFTTKSTGSGLGLAISKNIVEGSNGRIWFSTSDKGTTFYVSLRK